MARNTYGLDLGSYEIKVYDKKQDTIWTEKSVIAMKERQEIFAIGDEAYKMYEKAPDSIEVLFPMKTGVISGFHDMQFLLQNLLKKEIEADTAELASLQRLLEGSDRARVEVSETVYAGVRICISDVSTTIKSNMPYCKFIREEGEVKSVPL